VDVQFDVSGAELTLVTDHGLKTIPFLGDKAHELARSLGLKSDDSKEAYHGWLPTPDLAVSKETPAHTTALTSTSIGEQKRGRSGIRFSYPLNRDHSCHG
jgi:hypothetical protein